MIPIKIRRHWNSHNIGTTLLHCLKNIHWDDISGGVRRRAPQLFIHATVLCNAMNDYVDHSCIHGNGPHEIKICITKKDNSPKAYQELLKIAGPRPQQNRK